MPSEIARPEDATAEALMNGGVHPDGLLVDFELPDNLPDDARQTLSRLDEALRRQAATARFAEADFVGITADPRLSDTGRDEQRQKTLDARLAEFKTGSVFADAHKLLAQYKLESERDPMPDFDALPTGMEYVHGLRDSTDPKAGYEKHRAELMNSPAYATTVTEEIRSIRTLSLEHRDEYLARAVAANDTVAIQAVRMVNKRPPLDGPGFTSETYDLQMSLWRRANNPDAVAAHEAIQYGLARYLGGSNSLKEMVRQKSGVKQNPAATFVGPDGKKRKVR